MIGAATSDHWIELAAAIVTQAVQDKDYRYVAACQEAARNGAGCYAPLEAARMIADGWQPDEEDFNYAGNRQRKRASRNSKKMERRR